MKNVLLCVDTESARYPQAIGLAGEQFDSQDWLHVATTAEEARAYAREHVEVCDIWVASCDDMEPINLAARLKADNALRQVVMLSLQQSGSLMSRARAAGIDGALSHQAFVEQYASAKRVRLVDHAAEEFSAPTAASAGALSSEVPVATTSPAFVLTVVSGSGGAGKSTVAALAALFSQARGLKTLLIDCDLQFGDLRTLLNMPHAQTVNEAVANPALISRLTCEDGRPALLAAPARLEQAEEAYAAVPQLLTDASSHFDVIVVNTGAHWGEHHIALLERSTKALFLVDQRASSLRACKHAFELCARCGVATSPFVFVANRCSKTALFTSMDVSCAMHGAYAIELADGGSEVEELLSAGMPFELVAARNSFCVSLNEALEGILPPSETNSEGALAALSNEPRGFFQKWLIWKKGGAS